MRDWSSDSNRVRTFSGGRTERHHDDECRKKPITGVGSRFYFSAKWAGQAATASYPLPRKIGVAPQLLPWPAVKEIDLTAEDPIQTLYHRLWH